MAIQAVLWDLDGTLADTAMDLGGALNKLLKRNGLPEKNLSEIRPIASHGSSALIELGTGLTRDNPDFERWRQNYLDEYEQCFAEQTVLFDGVNNVLEELAQRQIVWGIITNKPKRFTNQLVPKLNCAVEPAVIVSGDTCAQAKPSVLPMHFACEHIGIAPENCLYIGDAERDMKAGKNAGMKTVLARWGYISAQDETEKWLWDEAISHPSEILNLLK